MKDNYKSGFLCRNGGDGSFVEWITSAAAQFLDGCINLFVFAWLLYALLCTVFRLVDLSFSLQN